MIELISLILSVSGLFYLLIKSRIRATSPLPQSVFQREMVVNYRDLSLCNYRSETRIPKTHIAMAGDHVIELNVEDMKRKFSRGLFEELVKIGGIIFKEREDHEMRSLVLTMESKVYV